MKFLPIFFSAVIPLCFVHGVTQAEDGLPLAEREMLRQDMRDYLREDCRREPHQPTRLRDEADRGALQSPFFPSPPHMGGPGEQGVPLRDERHKLHSEIKRRHLIVHWQRRCTEVRKMNAQEWEVFLHKRHEKQLKLVQQQKTNRPPKPLRGKKENDRRLFGAYTRTDWLYFRNHCENELPDIFRLEWTSVSN